MWTGAAPRAPSGTAATVYVVQRGYHTDIGLKVSETQGVLRQVAARFPGADSLLIGFGDRTFVTTRHKWLGTWLLTLLPGRGAMLVTGLRVSPAEAFPERNVVRIGLGEAPFLALAAYVSDSFAQTRAGEPVLIGPGPYAGSLFYASSRTYDLLDTCNTWTDAALAQAGLPVRPAMTLFAGQTMAQARRAATAPAAE